jgi:hypothetical protein
MIIFEGKLKKGEQLTQNKLCSSEKRMSQNVFSGEDSSVRKRSSWRYTEALLEQIATFDEARFDEKIFSVGVPTIKLRFEWTRRAPATFIIQVKRKALVKSGVSELYLEKAVNAMKAYGVNSIIKVME